MITLLLGGARSGKSEVAELMAGALPEPVTYVATADPGQDDDFSRRIERHRARRPSAWTTVEAGPDLPAALKGLTGTVLIDSLGTWVASAPDFEVDADPLCEVLSTHAGAVFVVSEEVGMGVHPSTEAGRRFRDALGDLNTRVAAIADEALLVVAGCTLRLDARFVQGAGR